MTDDDLTIEAQDQIIAMNRENRGDSIRQRLSDNSESIVSQATIDDGKGCTYFCAVGKSDVFHSWSPSTLSFWLTLDLAGETHEKLYALARTIFQAVGDNHSQMNSHSFTRSSSFEGIIEFHNVDHTETADANLVSKLSQAMNILENNHYKLR